MIVYQRFILNTHSLISNSLRVLDINLNSQIFLTGWQILKHTRWNAAFYA